MRKILLFLFVSIFIFGGNIIIIDRVSAQVPLPGHDVGGYDPDGPGGQDPSYGGYTPCPNEIGKDQVPTDNDFPTPTTTLSPSTCSCDGMSYAPQDFKEGDTIKITAYAKVTGENVNISQVKNILFSSGKKNGSKFDEENSQVSVPAVINKSSPNEVRYSATWEYTVPAELQKRTPYYVWTDIECVTKKAGAQNSQIISNTQDEKIVSGENVFEKIKNFFSSLFKKNSSQSIQSLPDQLEQDSLSEEALQINTFDIGISTVNSCRSIQIKKL
jgi:hypothetical protein